MTYDYKCDTCGEESELTGVALADRHKTWLCPKCQEGLMTRIPSAPGFSFKHGAPTPKSGRGRIK